MENIQLARSMVAYKPTNQIFIQNEKNYVQQYSHVYLKRLLALRPLLLKSFPRDIKVAEKIIELKANEHISVIGTLYKDQKLKPNILDEFSIKISVSKHRERRDNYASDNDTLLLEDESGRCNLIGINEEEWKKTCGELVSGIVVGCTGKVLENGSFQVKKMYFPGDAPVKEVSKFIFQDSEYKNPSLKKRYLLLTSGIYAGSTSDNNSVALQLLVDYIGGTFIPEITASIVRVVIAGGAVSPARADDTTKDMTIDPKFQVDTQEVLVDALRIADTWFSELASTCPVDVMPGEHDPCSMFMPQQPLHPCLFPTAFRYSNSFCSVSNPHSFLLGDNLNVLGHSGQPIQDAMKHMLPGTTPCELLERSVLNYRHLAPTAPDTLACYPFRDRDPFILEKDDTRLCFAGGFSSFESRYTRGIRFICIPEFKQTRQVVLVDLDSEELEAHVIRFNLSV